MYNEKDSFSNVVTVDAMQDPLTSDGIASYPVQCVAHRGSRVHWPENTMVAFRGAIDAGAQALETDVHLSKDGIAVLSHDSTLNRCYGIPGKVIDYEWAYLKTLRTVKEPNVPMPQLAELIEFLAQPQNSRIWLLLDIKSDNHADDVIKAIAAAISSVDSSNDFWRSRIQLGCWSTDFVPLCQELLPGFPITFIGYSLRAAAQFLDIPDANFNLLFPCIVGPFGREFVRKAQSMGREVYVWTLNDVVTMRWAMSIGVDGIVTDETELLIRMGKQPTQNLLSRSGTRSLNIVLYVWWLWLILPLYSAVFNPRARTMR